MPSRLSRPRLPSGMAVLLAALAVLVSALTGLLGHSTLGSSSAKVKAAAGSVSRESGPTVSRRAVTAATGALSAGTIVSARATDSGRSGTSGPGPGTAVVAGLLVFLLVGRLVGIRRSRTVVRATAPAVPNNRAPPARVVCSA